MERFVTKSIALSKNKCVATPAAIAVNAGECLRQTANYGQDDQKEERVAEGASAGNQTRRRGHARPSTTFHEVVEWILSDQIRQDGSDEHRQSAADPS